MDDKSIKILLVEDDPGDAGLIVALTKGDASPFEVTHVERLNEALERLNEGGIDLVFLDLSLPDVRGLEPVRRVSAAAPSVPIVVLTGLENEALALKAIQAGAQDYLLKGMIHRKMLLRVIRYCIERHRLRAALKEHKQELSRSEARFCTLIEENTDGMAVLDDKGIARFVNPALEHLFDVKAEELLGESFGFPVVAGETSEVEILRNDGETIVAEMRVAEIMWEGEAAYLASLREITERKRVQEELVVKTAALQERTADLAATNRELERKNQEMEQFVYTVSHDLKSPLVTMKGFVGVLKEDLCTGKNDLVMVMDSIGRVERAATRMSRLIEDLLRLSRAGQRGGKMEPLDVSVLVRELSVGLQPRLEELETTLEIHDEMPEIIADRTAISRVFENLLNNAIKYGCKGPHSKITVGSQVLDDEVRIFVKDNGPGIATKEHKKIFGLFQRLDSSEEGTGVGLAIVAKIMEVHNGRVWVESSPGKGATFWLSLDTARQAVSSSGTCSLETTRQD